MNKIYLLIISCINTYLSSKIRILVTHQIHFLTTASQIIFLSEGEIKFKGLFTEFANDLNLNDLLMTKQCSVDKSLNDIENQNEEELFENTAASESVPLKRCRSNLNRKMSIKSENLDINNGNLSDLHSLTSSCLFRAKSEKKADETDINEQNYAKSREQYEEKRTFGALNWKTYFIYFKVGGGIAGATLVLLTFFLSQAMVVLADYWLSTW